MTALDELSVPAPRPGLSDRRVVREGDLVEVEVMGRPFQLGGWKTRTAVDLVGDDRELRCVFNRWFLPAEGEVITILHHPELSSVLAFSRAGTMFAGHVRDGKTAVVTSFGGSTA